MNRPISGKDDPGKRRVFDHPGLRVMSALPQYIFAMKAFAARTRDVDDLGLPRDDGQLHLPGGGLLGYFM